MIAHILSHPLRLAASTLKITALTHLAFSHVLQVSPAQGPSMLPTFAVDGDWIAADMTCRRGRRIAVGDLVLYKIPLFPGQNGVKRVLGMPGDYVCLGTPGAGEDGGGGGGGSEVQMIQVPKGHCWIVGDNLPASRDSRQFGPLPLALVQGKIIARVLPWAERGWMGNGLDEVRDA
ncbi:Mitochondrial inner membrane protease subunit 1 [Escovopsis weberi]|uniref:Mitochondrial inner membrane protease subunit 1 n=1 Tax=Escovopsis weberi TaxID=150374 RepID=A0A0M8MQG3_ESCWE|nr:Mitochondrial inner membrane protease subunit 1 [Escovopsis weberi]